MQDNNEEREAVSREPSQGNSARKLSAVVLVLFAVGAIATWRVHHRDTLHAKAAPTQVPQASHATAIAVAAQPEKQPIPIEAPANVAQASADEGEIAIHPVEQFREELKKKLAAELASAYPQLPDLNREPFPKLDPDYNEAVFRFLEGAEKASASEQAAMFLAADFMLQGISCPSEQRPACEKLRDQFAQHKLTFAYSELGGGFFYQHDLLWRVWREHPESDWGERAFLLLLDSGWDTSGMCANGSDQFREVIRQGQTFLRERPSSPYRGLVTHLVGQAYATWWSLSLPPGKGMEDYVDPKQYTEGSEQARLRAIEYFEQVPQIAKGTLLEQYALEVLPRLREQRRLGTDGYRFFCVYD
jgi:hypothetical protein